MERRDSETPQPEPQGLANSSRSVYFSSSRRRGKDHPPLVFVSKNNCIADALETSPLKNRRPKQTANPNFAQYNRSKTPDITNFTVYTDDHNIKSSKVSEKYANPVIIRSSVHDVDRSSIPSKVTRLYREARSVSPMLNYISPNPPANPVNTQDQYIRRVQPIKRRVMRLDSKLN